MQNNSAALAQTTKRRTEPKSYNGTTRLIIQGETSMNIIIVSTTFTKKEDAERIAGLLLDRKLIACAQISGPITSIYRWQEKVTSATEYTLSLKTTQHLFQTVQETLIQEHPYELPEILGQEIHHVSRAYHDWVCGEVK